MGPRIKLLTLWQGPLPRWYNNFISRVASNSIVHWELVPVNVETINRLVYRTTGIPCLKATPYSLCDLRPLFGEMFYPKYVGYEWWGWCDLDIVLGDLDNLLSPLMEQYDVISVEEYTVSGPFAILRNTEKIVTLYRNEDYQEILSDPDYCNFDECGFSHQGLLNDNPSITRAIKHSGLRYKFDNRSWAESHQRLPNGVPSRCCKLVNGKLIEVPTDRELLLYHFTSKKWPIPSPYHDFIDDQIKLLSTTTERTQPTTIGESPEYWSNRLREVLASGIELHKSVLDTTLGGWERVQEHSRKVLASLTKPGDSILDAGCGYGAIASMAKELGLKYHGVDYCQDMVKLAAMTYPDLPFNWLHLDSLPFADHQFDWCFCRGLEGSTRTLLSNKQWKIMQKEMLRVARKLILIDSSMNHRVLES